MAGYTINLTDEETKALEKMYNTADLQEVLQKNIEVTAQNYIRDQYKVAVMNKTTEELKALAPEVKVERVVPQPAVEPEPKSAPEE